MFLSSSFILLTTVALVGIAAVQGLPSGPPFCFVGGSAVRASHLNATRNPQTGSIAVGGFDLFMDGTVVLSNTTRKFSIGTDHTISVSGTQAFRGAFFLVSANGTNVNTTLVPIAPLVLNPSCFGSAIAAVSHSEPSFKSNVSATLRLNDITTNVKLDVNIVVANNATNSIYYHTQFTLEAVAQTKPPTKAPTKAPSKAPTIAPVKAPTKAPTKKKPKDCGILGESVFCPFTRCGYWGRLLGLCKT